MKHTSSRTRFFLSLLLAFWLASHPARAEAVNDVRLPALEEFITSVQNGDAGVLRGIYIPSVLADEIVPQPEGEPGFVSTEENTLTQFGLASSYGSTGLLAHNHLAGREFSRINPGQLLVLVYGDGKTEWFVVKETLQFQALEPKNVRSHFIDLETGRLFSASGLFYHVYDQPGRVVLQTCIRAFGNFSWGRLFVIAEPYAAEEPEPAYTVVTMP